MKIYFDVSCINRPFDDQTQDKIHLEAEAVIVILKHIELGEWFLIGSGVVNYEIDKTPDKERKKRLQSLVHLASSFVMVGRNIHDRALQIRRIGIKAYDALHIACAEQGKADVFLSTDEKLVKIAKRHKNDIKVKVENPLIWLREV